MTQSWWLDPVHAIRQTLVAAGIRPGQVRAVGVSGLYPALGPTDADGVPLRRAILYSDNRAVAEVEEVNYRLNLRLSAEELTPKLIWFLRHEPDPAAQAVYDRFYPIYVGLHEALKPLYRRLHIAQTKNGV